jgi:hypothetical protein
MYAFLVLGIIPGTNIQIGFELWLRIVAAFASSVIISYYVLRIYEFFKLTNGLLPSYVPIRAQLHASQLHQRAR